MRRRSPTYDRSAIMSQAHRIYQAKRRLGQPATFGKCLSVAWNMAKRERDETSRLIAINSMVQSYGARQWNRSTR